MANPVKIKATVIEVVKHTDSVVSYRFAPEGRVPKFRAGQFLHLALDAYHPELPWPESRVFSIASPPSERRTELAITISVKGDYTQRMVDELKEGSTCWLKLPYGEFLFPENESLVLIAGGVGITPYIAFLKQILEEQSDQVVALHYGIRTKNHYLFADLLDQCVVELPNFTKVISCEDGSIDGEQGTLDIHAIHQASAQGALFYLSGPPAMIDQFKVQLKKFGVCSEQIRVDDWE